VIPARGGSKRVPRKNARAFCGKPMIAWSIEAALASKCFDRVIVSTDCDEISDIAVCAGAETPFVRPAELSGDHVPTLPVIQQAIDWLTVHGDKPDYVCCLYATAPFVSYDLIREAMQAVEQEDIDYAFAVTEYAFPIQRAIYLDCDLRVTMAQPQYFDVRSQDLLPAWHDAGQFYCGKVAAWQSGIQMFSVNSRAIKIPRIFSEDIDSESDWLRAELIFKSLKGLMLEKNVSSINDLYFKIGL
jgi:pseudaminic acid cytidylyltransferase